MAGTKNKTKQRPDYRPLGILWMKIYFLMSTVSSVSHRRDGIALPTKGNRSKIEECISISASVIIFQSDYSWIVRSPVHSFTQYRLVIYIFIKLYKSLQFVWLPWPNNLFYCCPIK